MSGPRARQESPMPENQEQPAATYMSLTRPRTLLAFGPPLLWVASVRTEARIELKPITCRVKGCPSFGEA
jgi:hypothetical protein